MARNPTEKMKPKNTTRCRLIIEAANSDTKPLIIIMAKVIYIDPVDHLKGKIGRKSKVVYKHMNQANKDGEKVNFTSLYEKPADHVPSAIEQASRNRFRAISARVRTAYATEATLNSYKAQFRAQSAVLSLRKFIWDAEAALYAAEQG